MTWTKPRIIRELRRHHRDGHKLAYNQLARSKQALVSAAAYHFGSYRLAVEAAGIPYSEITGRPRWTKQRIIRLIKQARRAGEQLHWFAVTRRGDDLARAAFAAIQPRLFGRWDRALHAAGLDADDVVMYRTWDKSSIVFDLKLRAQDGEALNRGAIQKDDPGLHSAATRYFGSYEAALRAAKFNPNRMRERRRWDKVSVIRGLKSALRRGLSSDTAVRRHDAGLHGAAVRLFGGFPAARAAAGIKLKQTRKK